jgi:hypothetical protein
LKRRFPNKLGTRNSDPLLLLTVTTFLINQMVKYGVLSVSHSSTDI